MKKNDFQSVSSSLARVDTKVKECYETQIRTFSCVDESFYSSLVTNKGIKKVLDVGCGEGSFVFNFAKKLTNTHIHAVEILPNLIATCIEQQAKLGIHNIEFHQGLFDDNFPQSEFDLITARFSVEHMQNVPSFLECCHKKLKTNGILAITEYCVLISGIESSIWQEFRERELSLYKKMESHSQISFQLPLFLKRNGFRNIKSQFVQISPSTVNPDDFYDLVDVYAVLYNEIDSQNWPNDFVQHIKDWTQSQRVSATCDPAMWLTQTKAEK